MTYTISMTVYRDDIDIPVRVTGDYTAAQKGCHTQANGDPGWPDEPAEFEPTECVVTEDVRDEDTGEVLFAKGASIDLTDDEYSEACEKVEAEIEDEYTESRIAAMEDRGNE